MISKKKSDKTKNVSVTFSLPAEVASESVAIVGDFNNWDESKHAMTRDKKSGEWKKNVQLKPGRYEFRYLIDGARWENDRDADGSAPTPFFSENSVIEI